nr:uncharacterized protein LOC109185271 [Ipomoea trifida]
MDSRGKKANFGRDTGPPGDEWGLICLKEKAGEIGYVMDDSLRYFIVTGVGLEELVLENWIVKGGVGDDADECDGSGFEWYDSGEESNGSDEDYNSEDLVNIDVHDDDEFVKNIDVTVEFSGLSNVQLQPQQGNVQVQPQQGDEVNNSNEGNLVGSDGEIGGLKRQKFLKDLERYLS